MGGLYAVAVKRALLVAADKLNFTWLNLKSAIRYENYWIWKGQQARCDSPTWHLTITQDQFMQSDESCRELTEGAESRLLLKGSYLLHLPLLLLNNLIQQGLEAVLLRRRRHTRWASLNCDGFKCVSAWAAHVPISALTERPLGMPVRDSWPFLCDCDNNDWRLGFDGPKTPGNESSKWQSKKGHVCSCFTHCRASTKERLGEQLIFMPQQCLYSKVQMGEN